MKHVLALVFALIGIVPRADACTDGAAMTYYFFDRQPDGRAERDVLPIQILAIEGDRVRAQVGASVAKALGGDIVTIDLPAYPQGTNCIDYGLTSGPAFVVVEHLYQLKSGEVHIVAAHLREGYDTRRRRSRAELDRYIVDPAVKEAAARDGRAQ
ncbi:hypothetical protein FHS95_001450 [Sphingomonas naasensis]|uniref:Uncharacterized protein n=1 Tax=Sphingomonas naasensis TaxID=1344951 RepID=A0A4S1WC61_9SPHN|nr:hypothetical protein [Sphingomonas naasensis]NIJ19781.1 hypothetical protein [Sphingomonas naasensis]TGX40083.1 hypothetical protein E5A74_16055 [Sphingomonas naasensis]